MSNVENQVDEATAPEGAVASDAPSAAEAPAVSVEDLAQEVEQWKDHARRAQAEFENTRKRLVAAHADEVKRAGIRVVDSLIPVIDDIEYALSHAQETGNQMGEGLAAIHTKFLAALEREGVEVLNPQGQPFDSETAQAVAMVESSDVDPDTVVEVVQKGYRLGGKVLRPAMVAVSST